MNVLQSTNTSDGGRKLSADKRKINKQKKYLAQWDTMFERLVKYKEKYGRTTVSKNCDDRKLYNWYRKQKLIYNHPTKKLPKNHLKKLNSINFYFGDGHKEGIKKTEENWLALLKEAINNGENVQPNHRYKYKGKGLGTFLVEVKKKNKLGKKLELFEKIKKIGLDMDKVSRNPNIVVWRILDQLKNDKNPIKANYQNRFNSNILLKLDTLTNDFRTEFSKVWFEKFNEERTWKHVSRSKSADEIIEKIINDIIRNPAPKLNVFLPRFRYGVLKRKNEVSIEVKEKLSKIWLLRFGEDLDWNFKRITRSDEKTVKNFLEDLKSPEYKKTKSVILIRLRKYIYPKLEKVDKKIVSEIKIAWKKRFKEDLVLENIKPIPIYKKKKRNQVLNNKTFVNQSVIDRKPSLETIKHLSNSDRVKLWKEFRYNEVVNPKGKWKTGPKSMGNSLYTWVNKLRKNKHDLADVIQLFSLQEAKEIKREGFLVDLRVFKKNTEHQKKDAIFV